jgi:arginine utilization protein RocB
VSGPLDPAAVRALTRTLVAIPSVSPDVESETRCAETLAAHLPAECDAGMWSAPDGRPVVWALARGASPRTTILLGHYDTVGVDDLEQAGVPRALAFDLDGYGAWLAERRRDGRAFPADVDADLEAERQAPGTWCFGRGALDMKAGLAAGLAALEALVRGPRAGHVLFVATPDEEHASAGMLTAVEELTRLRDARGLDYVGAINLDYADAPCAHHGVLGKMAVGCLVHGITGHAAAPDDGRDAAYLAALAASCRFESDAFVARLTRLRDLKPGYDAQTAAAAVVEWSVVSERGDPDAVLVAIRDAIRARWREARGGGEAPPVRLWAEAGDGAAAASGRPAPFGRARAAALERVRARASREAGAGAILFLMPPYYPPLRARPSAVAGAAAAVLARAEIAVRGPFPYISDASYLAWHGASPETIARHLPGFGAEYALPHRASAELDLDVVNLGPWGRAAHGVYERVHAPWAFGTLPGLIADVVAASWEPSPRR